MGAGRGRSGFVSVRTGAQVAEGCDSGDGVVFEFDAELLFEGGLQLHAAEAVEMEVFGEAELIVVGCGVE